MASKKERRGAEKKKSNSRIGKKITIEGMAEKRENTTRHGRATKKSGIVNWKEKDGRRSPLKYRYSQLATKDHSGKRRSTTQRLVISGSRRSGRGGGMTGGEKGDLKS